MTSKHTPGPWLWHDKSTLHMNDSRIASVGEHLKIVSHTECVDRLEATANARLIAAAPDLLAACVVALDELENMQGIDDASDDTFEMIRNAVRLAIAKGTA